jgi:hypothetical protein
MRPRNRVAVSVFVFQIGSSARNTRPVSTSATFKQQFSLMANPHKVLDKSSLFLYNGMGYHKPGNDIGISLSTAGQDAIDF